MKETFYFTYVVYDEGDVVGLILALITLTPIYIMNFYTTLILLRRDFGTFFALAGQIACLALNVILKKILHQPRPADLGLIDSGMPSNHSQFMGYFAVFYSIQFLYNSPSLSEHFRRIYALLLAALAILVCFSRIYLQYHTVDQVAIGFAVGAFCGIAWSIIDIYVGDAIGTMVCSIPMVKDLGVRHYSPLEEYLGIRKKVPTLSRRKQQKGL